MSEQRLLALTTHCIESDENYKRDSDEILQNVAKSQKKLCNCSPQSRL